MKRFHIVTLLIIGMLFTATSCSKEEQMGPPEPPQIGNRHQQKTLMPDMPEPHKRAQKANTPPTMPKRIKRPDIKKEKPTTIIPPAATLTEEVTQPLITLIDQKKVTAPASSHSSDNPNEIDFDVENTTGKTLYVACFAWQRKHKIHNWRWDKSDVYEIKPGQMVTIDVDTIPDPQDREKVFAYLSVHTNKDDAEEATYELLDDKNKLDLDQLIKLKEKKVTLMVEKYGFKGELFEYDFVEKKKDEETIPELDFAVENQTGKTLLVTCFVYGKKAKGSWLAAEEKKDDMSVWRFDKTPLIKLKPGQIGIIDVDTIPTARDRSYMRAVLAVFEEYEEEEARESTYELLETYRKLNLGDINDLKNRKVVIQIEKYGFLEDFLDYIVKPARHIDFATINK